LTIQKKIVRTLKLYYLEKLYVKKSHTIYKYFKWDLGFGMGFGIWDLEWDLGFGIWDGIWDWDGNGIWDLGWDGMGWDGMGWDLIWAASIIIYINSHYENEIYT